MANFSDDKSALDALRSQHDALLAEVGKVIVGQDQVIREVTTAIFAGGHILLVGVPGLAKTLLVNTIAQALGLSFNRIQFTPDLMPSDIVGSEILDESRQFKFVKGPLFANIVLADEINRTPPKTQAALLEAMQERAVTAAGQRYPLPAPFFVLATQNPIEQEGTYPLPEAQLDRFLFQVLVQPVGPEVLTQIIQSRRHGRPPEPEPVAGLAEFQTFHERAGRVHLPQAVGAYIGRLCAATHPSSEAAPERVRDYVRYGASPRAAIAISEAARVDALLHGKPTVGFDDVKRVARPALVHRVVLDYRARLDGVTPTSVVEELLAAVTELEQPLPSEVVDADA